MEKTIKPYQYYFIKREVEQLLSAYSSVNDPKTVQTVQALAAEKIHEVLGHPNTAVNEFMEKVLDVTLKKRKSRTTIRGIESDRSSIHTTDKTADR